VEHNKQLAFQYQTLLGRILLLYSFGRTFMENFVEVGSFLDILCVKGGGINYRYGNGVRK